MADRPIIEESFKAPSTFKRQLFGPWTSNDPKVQEQIVRTRPSSGFTQRRFTSTYPPAPTINSKKTAISNGFAFTFNIVSGSVAGYNIYKSIINNPNVATLLDFKAQPPIVQALQSIRIQDIDSGSPFYWVASVNAAGKESARIPVTGNSPAPSPAQPLPTGGGSGSGTGGGGGGGVLNWKIKTL
jgi:hypothetical protein